MVDEIYMDPLFANLLDKVKVGVIDKDKDWVSVVDGDEGGGKSVLAMNIAKYLDPNFTLDNITFNSEQFIDRLKTAPKYSCIVLDEAFNAANSRSSLTTINKSLIAVATEMRQRNLFVLIVIPSFFDLDKYFALWRCKSLIHVYLKPNGDRGQFVIFPKDVKKNLYILGKKFYNYSKPRSPFPPMKFKKRYPVDEMEYRKKKADAFQDRERPLSPSQQRWVAQRNALIKHIHKLGGYTYPAIVKIFDDAGVIGIGEKEVCNIMLDYKG